VAVIPTALWWRVAVGADVGEVAEFFVQDGADLAGGGFARLLDGGAVPQGVGVGGARAVVDFGPGDFQAVGRFVVGHAAGAVRLGLGADASEDVPEFLGKIEDLFLRGLDDFGRGGEEGGAARVPVRLVHGIGDLHAGLECAVLLADRGFFSVARGGHFLRELPGLRDNRFGIFAGRLRHRGLRCGLGFGSG